MLWLAMLWLQLHWWQPVLWVLRWVLQILTGCREQAVLGDCAWPQVGSKCSGHTRLSRDHGGLHFLYSDNDTWMPSQSLKPNNLAHLAAQPQRFPTHLGPVLHLKAMVQWAGNAVAQLSGCCQTEELEDLRFGRRMSFVSTPWRDESVRVQLEDAASQTTWWIFENQLQLDLTGLCWTLSRRGYRGTRYEQDKKLMMAAFLRETYGILKIETPENQKTSQSGKNQGWNHF